MRKRAKVARLNNALNRDAAMMVVSALRDEPVALRRQQPSVEAGALAPPRAGAARLPARAADSAEAQGGELMPPRSAAQPVKLSKIGEKKPKAMRTAPRAPSATLSQTRAPMPVMIAAEASTIAIWARPLPSS